MPTRLSRSEPSKVRAQAYRGPRSQALKGTDRPRLRRFTIEPGRYRRAYFFRKNFVVSPRTRSFTGKVAANSMTPWSRNGVRSSTAESILARSALVSSPSASLVSRSICCTVSSSLSADCPAARGSTTLKPSRPRTARRRFEGQVKRGASAARGPSKEGRVADVDDACARDVVTAGAADCDAAVVAAMMPGVDAVGAWRGLRRGGASAPVQEPTAPGKIAAHVT